MEKNFVRIIAVITFLTIVAPLASGMNTGFITPIAGHKENADDATYYSCYIEATGPFDHGVHMLLFRPLGGDFVISFLSKIIFGDCAFVTLYAQKDGDVLSQYHGQHTLFLMGFHGNYFHHGTYIKLVGTALLIHVS